jgi:hypothetical protein
MFFLQVINKHTPQNGANPTLRSRFSMWTDYPKVFGEDQGESMYNKSQCLRHATASRQLHARFVPKDPYPSQQDVGINTMSAESLAWRGVICTTNPYPIILESKVRNKEKDGNRGSCSDRFGMSKRWRMSWNAGREKSCAMREKMQSYSISSNASF